MSRRKIRNRARYQTRRDGRSPFDRIELPDGLPRDPAGADGIVKELKSYIQAHALLPPSYVFDGTVGAKLLVERAAAVVDTSTNEDEETISAIVLLGHSPCERAIQTLTTFAETAHPLAGTARFALIECIKLYTTPYAGVVPELPVR